MATRGTPALLVIDMISRLDFDGAERMAGAAIAAARRIHRLRQHFHRNGWPVIYVNDNFAQWQADFRELIAMAAAAGDAPRQIATLLDPDPRDHFVLKPKHSAFLATPLPVLLAKLDVRELLLTGMALESCILATALDANAREYAVAVARDAVAGLPRLRKPTLDVLAGAKAARVINSASALAWRAPARMRRAG